MRNNNGFVVGMIAGAAIGALTVMSLTPQVRKPIMQGAGDMGNRMRKMWRRTSDAAFAAIPDELT